MKLVELYVVIFTYYVAASVTYQKGRDLMKDGAD